MGDAGLIITFVEAIRRMILLIMEGSHIFKISL